MAASGGGGGIGGGGSGGRAGEEINSNEQITKVHDSSRKWTKPFLQQREPR